MLAPRSENSTSDHRAAIGGRWAEGKCLKGEMNRITGRRGTAEIRGQRTEALGIYNSGCSIMRPLLILGLLPWNRVERTGGFHVFGQRQIECQRRLPPVAHPDCWAARQAAKAHKPRRGDMVLSRTCHAAPTGLAERIGGAVAITMPLLRSWSRVASRRSGDRGRRNQPVLTACIRSSAHLVRSPDASDIPVAFRKTCFGFDRAAAMAVALEHRYAH